MSGPVQCRYVELKCGIVENPIHEGKERDECKTRGSPWRMDVLWLFRWSPLRFLAPLPSGPQSRGEHALHGASLERRLR